MHNKAHAGVFCFMVDYDTGHRQLCAVLQHMKHPETSSTKGVIAPPWDPRTPLVSSCHWCIWLEQLTIPNSFSGWFEINPLKTLSSQNVINKLERQSSMHSIPQK